MTDIVERLRNYGLSHMKGVPLVITEAADEIERLRERLGPHGLEVVLIDGSGHYVNVKVKAEIERLRKALREIAEFTSPLHEAGAIARAALEMKHAEIERLRALQPEGKAEVVVWQRKHPTEGWSLVHECDIPYYKRKGQEIRALYAQPSGQTLPKPGRNDGGEPCGECHLQPGETCDICGAAQPSGQTRAEIERETDAQVTSVRKMLAEGINIQATGDYTNDLITAILQGLIEHIDEQDADLKAAIAVGRYAAAMGRQTRAEIIEECAKVAEQAEHYRESSAKAIRALAAKEKQPTGMWPDWGDRPDGFDGPGGAE